MAKGTTANTITSRDTVMDIGMLTAMNTATGTVMDKGTDTEMGTAMGTYLATPHEATRHYICLRQRKKIRPLLERKIDRQ